MHLAGHEDYKDITEDPRLEDRAHFELVVPRMDLRDQVDPAVEPADPLVYDRGMETCFDDWVSVTIPVGADEFVLGVARERCYWLPATCQQGWCTTCAGRVLDGSVENAAAKRYDDVDREAG